MRHNKKGNRFFGTQTGLFFLSSFVLLMTLIAACGGVVPPPPKKAGTEPEAIPKVVLIVPADQAKNQSTSTSILVTFSKEMSPETVIAAFSLTDDLGQNVPVEAKLTKVRDEMAADFTPTTPLADSKTYTASLKASAQDLFGNFLEGDKIWTFTTVAPPDPGAPIPPATGLTIISIDPPNGAQNVSVDTHITVTFSEVIKPETITVFSDNFSVGGRVKAQDIVPSNGNKTFTFVPTEKLRFDKDYGVTVTTGVTAVSGNSLASSPLWRFRTGVPLEDF